MRRQLITGLRTMVCLLVLTCVVYPLVVWGIGQVAFHDKANGSLVKVDGKIVGSALIGQTWNDADGKPLPQYFQPRPSAAGDGYDPSASSGTNLGPSNPKLIDAVQERVKEYRSLNDLPANARVPVDAVTSSGSGLDPDISVANALDQAARVARARGVPTDVVVRLVKAHIRERAWGILGERSVNVLDLNLALDQLS